MKADGSPDGGTNGYYLDETTYYRRYSRELTIEVQDSRAFGINNNNGNDKYLNIYFRNPLTEAQMKNDSAQF
jgi:hypothetical protein